MFSVVVDSLLIVAPVFMVSFCVWSLLCYIVLSVLYRFTIISLSKGGQVTLLYELWLSMFCVSPSRCRGLVSSV